MGNTIGASVGWNREELVRILHEGAEMNVRDIGISSDTFLWGVREEAKRSGFICLASRSDYFPRRTIVNDALGEIFIKGDDNNIHWLEQYQALKSNQSVKRIVLRIWDKPRDEDMISNEFLFCEKKNLEKIILDMKELVG